MAPLAIAQSTDSAATVASTDGGPHDSAIEKNENAVDKGGFLHRLAKLIGTTGQSQQTIPIRLDAAILRRCPRLPSPLPIGPTGGSPVIGASDTSGGPLMQAIYSDNHGKEWENRRIKIHGWVNRGFNASYASDIIYHF